MHSQLATKYLGELLEECFNFVEYLKSHCNFSLLSTSELFRFHYHEELLHVPRMHVTKLIFFVLKNCVSAKPQYAIDHYKVKGPDSFKAYFRQFDFLCRIGERSCLIRWLVAIWVAFTFLIERFQNCHISKLNKNAVLTVYLRFLNKILSAPN